MKLGIDTGGTFTDFFLLNGTAVATHKVSSTPDDPVRAILAGLLHFFPHPDDPSRLAMPAELEIVHGTTVGTNAFLQRRGARTLLITTAGFEDVLIIGRQNRAALYDLRIERSPAIIDPACCVGVKERLRSDGSVLQPLGKTIGKRLRRLCRQHAIEAVAVCLLHAYANDEHERLIAAALAGLALPVSLSSQVLPEFREFERMATTAINAYLAPVVSTYIEKLAAEVAPVSLSIQQSNGGLLPARAIGERAVHTLLSGPAGGVHGAWQLARAMGRERIITFDMGGTSTDVALCNGRPALTRDYRIDSWPVRIPVMDIHTVGAGGGSIVAIDRGGLLHVGPRSAGAEPGPVCYGLGEELTVTDANLFLGRLLPQRFLAGRMPLFPERVEERMKRLGAELGLTAREAALGIIRVVNAEMAKAVRAVSMERGHDPKEFSLFSFGGASGLHCCQLIAEPGITALGGRARAGILSAQGMAMADVVLDGSRAFFLSGRQLPRHLLTAAFAELVAEKQDELAAFSGRRSCQVQCSVDVRYQGQSFEITVPFDETFPASFHTMHRQQFGYALPDHDLEVVAIRCSLTIPGPVVSFPRSPVSHMGTPMPVERVPVIFDEGTREASLFSRNRLCCGQQLCGPALIVDAYTTILLPGGFFLQVDEMDNLIIRPD
ncbi:MAG: hydantoinase/oxoprolinase family protein [Thermodesulfobacteriota bacterium]